MARTQELQLAVSSDGGTTYREVIRQEYNFSPPGTTFEREDWAVPASGVTHLRLQIRPDKGGKPCRARWATAFRSEWGWVCTTYQRGSLMTITPPDHATAHEGAREPVRAPGRTG